MSKKVQPPMTLGQLIAQIESVDAAVSKPLPPEVEQITHFAHHEWSASLQPPIVRRLADLVCAKMGVSPTEANSLDLSTVAESLTTVRKDKRGMFRISPSERVKAYLIDVQGVEAGWINHASYLKSHQFGFSPWVRFGAKLDEIKRRHGFEPDNPIVQSITAYVDEENQIRRERDFERLRDGWPSSPDDPEYSRSWQRDMFFIYRLDNCRARHFPRLSLSDLDIRTCADLWAYIQFRLRPSRNAIEQSSRERPALCPDDLLLVYRQMLHLEIDDAPSPPYPGLTPAEAENELLRIGNSLAKADRRTHDEALNDDSTEEPAACRSRRKSLEERSDTKSKAKRNLFENLVALRRKGESQRGCAKRLARSPGRDLQELAKTSGYPEGITEGLVKAAFQFDLDRKKRMTQQTHPSARN